MTSITWLQHACLPGEMQAELGLGWDWQFFFIFLFLVGEIDIIWSAQIRTRYMDGLDQNLGLKQMAYGLWQIQVHYQAPMIK